METKTKQIQSEFKSNNNAENSDVAGDVENVLNINNQDEIVENRKDGDQKTKAKKKNKSQHKDKMKNDIKKSDVEITSVAMDTERAEQEMKTDEVCKKKKKKHKESKKSLEEDITSEEKHECLKTHEEITEDHKKSKKNKRKHLIAENEGEMSDVSEKKKKETTEESFSKSKKQKKKKKKKDYTRENHDESISENQKQNAPSLLSSNKNDNSIFNGNRKSNSENSVDSVCLGQWETASLGNKDRQQKFLRLLGGFKKGDDSNNKSIFSSLGAKPKGGNLALNKKQEEDLSKNLMSSFQKALDYKLFKNKGVGLGFSPPAGDGKKFHIDTNVTKSKRFDDSD